VREGTIISALLIGTIAGFYGRKLSFLPGLLFGEKNLKKKKNRQNRKMVWSSPLQENMAAADTTLAKHWQKNWAFLSMTEASLI
uniref:hypothetical protein n=1 Tax=Anaerotignum lactatifermentans TaxID=160404 RepID=UPI00307AB9C4